MWGAPKSLSNLFDYSIATCTFPTCWKLGQVTPVFKKGIEYSKSNYRPITTLATFGSIFKRIIAGQLNEFFSDKLSQFLSAYRHHYSCETTLINLLEEFRNGLDKQNFASITSIDLSKAFDGLPHDLILAKLAAYGISPKSCAFIGNYLTDHL